MYSLEPLLYKKEKKKKKLYKNYFNKNADKKRAHIQASRAV